MTTPPSLPTVRKLGPRPIVLRELRVVRRFALTPRMIRVTLGGGPLDGFTTYAPDDHVVLFFLRDGQAVPTNGEDGRRPIWTERPPTRDYTVRRFDDAAGELDIDFVLHGAGVASTWAESVQVGARIAASDPRTSLVADGFEHLLLIGDESALPTIARRVEELGSNTTAQVFVEVAGPHEEQPLADRAGIDVTWLHRGDRAPGTTPLLLDAVRTADLASNRGAATVYACVAGETDVVRSLRHHLLAERGFTPAHTRFSGYWKRET